MRCKESSVRGTPVVSGHYAAIAMQHALAMRRKSG